ncbi:MAG: pirin [Dehalococcoidia bacterium]|nr:pirin [Dehalococcoidia bacterium]
MPTVDIDNIKVLPYVSSVNPHAVSRCVVKKVDAVSGFEGEGFPVNRAFARLSTAETDPFIMMDEMGAVEYAPGEPRGTPWHPHRGFETVTYLIDGIFNHQDSHGGGGVIKDGDTQWMTAGSGLLHIEKPPEELVVSGGLFHGIQLWVNLSSRLKWVAPRYQDIRANKLKLARSQDSGALIRIIAGNVDVSLKGPGVTYSPINLFHVTVAPSSRLELNWPSNYNAIAYVLSGTGFAGHDMVEIFPSQTCLFGQGEVLTITAKDKQESRSPKLEVLLLGGEPIQEPIAWYGPFVMNSDSELKNAFDDYRKGKLGVIPAT